MEAAQRSDDCTRAPSVTRRSFVRLAALVAGTASGATALGLVGCHAPDPSPPAPQPDNDFGADVGLPLADIHAAREVLADVALVTPLLPARSLGGDADVYLKLENLQITGSFKLRGAYNFIAGMSDEEKALGVVTASAGNHAQGVGYAAHHFGTAGVIFIPATAPKEKIDATRAYGVEVRLVDGGFDDAKLQAETFAEDTGMMYVPPFDEYRIMAGQGVVGLDICEELPSVDAIVVPVGGGGLIGGIAVAAKGTNTSVRVYGVQAAAAPSAVAALGAGGPVTVEEEATLADGIHVARTGDRTYPIIERYVDEVVTVSEEQIADAMLELLDRSKTVAEGAGAVSVAAVKAGLLPIDAGETVVCVVSGGNLDDAALSALIDAADG